MPTIRLAAEPAAALTHRPDAERVLAGDPVQSIWNAHDSADGRFSAGIWACEPGLWRIAYAEDELCHLLEGEVVLRGDDGSEATYRAGDSFVVPAGFTGTWEVTRRVRKVYAIYQA